MVSQVLEDKQLVLKLFVKHKKSASKLDSQPFSSSASYIAWGVLDSRKCYGIPTVQLY